MANITDLTTLGKTSVTANDFFLTANSARGDNKKFGVSNLFPTVQSKSGVTGIALFVDVTDKNVINLKGIKYLNRGAGTRICGPLLFNTNKDKGTSGFSLEDVTSSALLIEENLRTTFNLADTSAILYQFSDNCSPLAVGVCN